ncbi:MAG: response regulator transcription factor [Bacteroidaceae bacterium]|nr:response regulator transcription factor [Bacteroidaceae bacterium]
MSRILIIDDDKAFCTTVSVMLQKLGHEVVVLNTLRDISKKMEQIKPDMILLDIEFPDADGIRRLPDIKMAAPDVPIVLVSSHSEDSYVSRAIKSKGDFFLQKPIGFATLRETIRRFDTHQPLHLPLLSFGDYVLDVKAHELKRGSQVIGNLTPQETRFLAYIASHPNQVITFDEINLHVWGDEVGNQHGLYNLKAKINKLLKDDKNIEIITLNRVGFKLSIL